jgi:hypothetical protein
VAVDDAADVTELVVAARLEEMLLEVDLAVELAGVYVAGVAPMTEARTAASTPCPDFEST